MFLTGEFAWGRRSNRGWG